MTIKNICKVNNLGARSKLRAFGFRVKNWLRIKSSGFGGSRKQLSSNSPLSQRDDECVASTIGSKLKQSAVAKVSPDCISRKRQKLCKTTDF